MKAFECKNCGVCCYGMGGILVNDQERRNIAAYLGVSVERFEETCCEIRNLKTYVRSGEDGYCVFFHKERRCLIHPVKPGPCRLWPFYPALLKDRGSWKAAMDACPGINPDASYEDFVKESGT
jgi:uncharacterized protein